jgi:hypothetical protein
MKREHERAIEALVKVARPIIRERFNLASCIASTRVGLLALAEFGVQAHPQAVEYLIVNNDFRELTAELGRMPSVEEQQTLRDGAAHSFGLGVNRGPDDTGHVAIAVGARLLVDLSIDQASRPAKGWAFYEPLVATLPGGWKKGAERYMTHTPTYTIGIQAIRDNKAYLRSRDWTLRERWEPTVRKVVAAMRRELA